MISPVGALIVEAGTKAKKKPSKTHTAVASCGCEVTVSWFSENSHTIGTSRCTEHPVRVRTA